MWHFSTFSGCHHTTGVITRLGYSHYIYVCCLVLQCFLMHCVSMQTGEVPVCDPRMFVECLQMAQAKYVSNNEAANCNCPRQCRRLSYQPTISQAPIATTAAEYMIRALNANITVNEMILDYCTVQVRKSIIFTSTFVLSLSVLHNGKFQVFPSPFLSSVLCFPFIIISTNEVQ